jgi:hypothetical protein
MTPRRGAVSLNTEALKHHERCGHEHGLNEALDIRIRDTSIAGAWRPRSGGDERMTLILRCGGLTTYSNYKVLIKHLSSHLAVQLHRSYHESRFRFRGYILVVLDDAKIGDPMKQAATWQAEINASPHWQLAGARAATGGAKLTGTQEEEAEEKIEGCAPGSGLDPKGRLNL